MKTQILDIHGKKTKEITTELFEEPIREDIIFKVIEATRIWQPYSNNPWGGMNRSATGNLRHTRNVWKTDRGKGLSRVPRKIMWRRGTQFSWVGAITPQTKGGRRAHPPKNRLNLKKINKKEFKKAMLSALSYSNSLEEIKNKYSSLKNKKIEISLPIIVEDKILSLNTKEFLKSINLILGELNSIAIQHRTIRAGKGKSRGRKYKKNAGALLVIGDKENKKINGIEIIKSNNLKVRDLAAGGARITIFTEKAIKDLENRLIIKENKNKEDKK